MSDNADRVARFAMDSFSALARRASTITAGLALVAFVVVGGALIVGLAAFNEGRAAWGVIGGLMLIVAVGAPLLATLRLRAIPRDASKLLGELRSLIGHNDDARGIVVDTVAYDDDRPASDADRPETTLPAVVFRSQQYTRLRTIASGSGEFATLAATLRRVTTIPWLLIVSVLTILVAALLGFVFTLIWIF